LFRFCGVPRRFLSALFGVAFTVLAAFTPHVLADAGVEEALRSDPEPHATHPQAVVELTVPSHGARLPGHIYLANGPGPHPTVVLLHGLPGAERNLDLAQALRRHGFNTLFFHYRGAWGADGQYRFTQLPEDALAVLDWLRQEEQARALRVDPEALSVLGHSLGGYTALAAGARDSELSCVVALAPANLGVWQRWVKENDPQVERLVAYSDSLFMLRGLSGARFLEELAYAPREVLDTETFGAGLRGRKMLLLVGEADTVTPASTMFDPVVAAYREAGVEDIRALKLPGDHSFSQSLVRLSREVLSWMGDHCRT
jgi:pimeloyl-ACP methyl ester carboxylesterase